MIDIILPWAFVTAAAAIIIAGIILLVGMCSLIAFLIRSFTEENDKE